jgi:hypothetical protein
MPLTTTDRLRFVEFLGLLAGLFVVFVSTSSNDFVYFPFGLPTESVFVLLLIVFIAYSLFVYAEILSREKSSTKFMFTAAIYFSIILSLLFSGTILKAVKIETSTSPEAAALLFTGIALFYNIAILIPIQKIMRNEPLKVEIQEAPKESPSVIP